MNLYDNQTRSMLQTDAALSPGRQPGVPGTRRETERRRLHRRVLLGPTRPDGVAAGNWIQTDPEQGLVRRSCGCYSPLQPFFDKSWRPSEIEPI